MTLVTWRRNRRCGVYEGLQYFTPASLVHCACLCGCQRLADVSRTYQSLCAALGYVRWP